MTKQQKAKLKEAEEEYGDIKGMLAHLQELAGLDDLRHDDVMRTTRDINFIRGKADLKPLAPEQIIEMIV